MKIFKNLSTIFKKQSIINDISINIHNDSEKYRQSLHSKNRILAINFSKHIVQWITLSALFSWLTWPSSLSFISKCTQVQAQPISPILVDNQQQWPSSILPSSLSLSLISSIYRCNMTTYPENNGCHPLAASCDQESQLCICSSNEQQTDSNIDIYNNVYDDNISNKKQRHYEHKRIDIYQCLPRKKLGQSCQHSAQCYSMIIGSGCYRQKQQQHEQQQTFVNDDHWKCSCAFGFKGML